MTVLLLTARLDLHADLLVEELDGRGVDVVRVDTGDFPGSLRVAASFDGGGSGGRWRGLLATGRRSLDLDAVSGAYYRRPAPFRLAEGLPEEERRWAALEARVGLGGLLATLPCWLNHPSRIGAAEYKPVQLAAAATAGLRTPRTLITNDPAAAVAFAREVGEVVYKPFSSVTELDGARAFVYTTPVGVQQLADEGIRHTAHLFQQWVDKAYEVRLTVVDDRRLAARLTAGSAAAHVDWRSDYPAVRYDTVDVPPEVATGVAGMLAALGLRFAAMDFAVTRDGRWVFLDLNPNGQWAWIEQETGLPICAALADALTTGPVPAPTGQPVA